MLTSDDRVAELIEEVAAHDPNSRKYPSFDLIVTPLATGSVEYIQWVKDQTLKKDPDAAFFNKGPSKAMKHDDTKVADAKAVEQVSVKKFVAPPTPSEDDLVMSNQQHGATKQAKKSNLKEEDEEDDNDSEDGEDEEEEDEGKE
jgi:hypothetical protein